MARLSEGGLRGNGRRENRGRLLYTTSRRASTRRSEELAGRKDGWIGADSERMNGAPRRKGRPSGASSHALSADVRLLSARVPARGRRAGGRGVPGLQERRAGT